LFKNATKLQQYFEIPTFGYCANHENVVTLHRYCNKMTTAICRFSRLQILLYKDIEKDLNRIFKNSKII